MGLVGTFRLVSHIGGQAMNDNDASVTGKSVRRPPWTKGKLIGANRGRIPRDTLCDPKTIPSLKDDKLTRLELSFENQIGVERAATMPQVNSFGADEARTDRHAARYVRMSTDHQRYSTQN